ncbi:MAG: low molecular weight phosphotyrosine protein phosphatase [Oscillospiraceae bacterium]|nr:low molecular weight phosphotyrosine protein phosphatase [Oscillospiraceae bacterium]
MIKILFVCHGNICRSPMAEFVMKKLVKDAGLDSKIVVDSCATSREEIGNDMYPPAKQKLREKGVPFAKRAARQITKADYAAADYVVAMDRYNLRNLDRVLGGDPDGKISLLLSHAGRSADISDPWYTDDFESTYRDVLEGCSALLEALK